mgnify:CR=1 FL=1
MVARAPRKKMYKSMQGRMIDIEKLRAANETTQAVGNMNVNARGDVLGAGGQIVTPKETIIQKYYEQPKGMASDTPPPKPMPAPKGPPPKPVQKVVTSKPSPKKKVATQTKKAESTTKKGIDAALDGLE